MVCIWSTSAELIWGVASIRSIIFNMHTWASRILKPRLQHCVQQLSERTRPSTPVNSLGSAYLTRPASALGSSRSPSPSRSLVQTYSRKHAPRSSGSPNCTSTSATPRGKSFESPYDVHHMPSTSSSPRELGNRTAARSHKNSPLATKSLDQVKNRAQISPSKAKPVTSNKTSRTRPGVEGLIDAFASSSLEEPSHTQRRNLQAVSAGSAKRLSKSVTKNKFHTPRMLRALSSGHGSADERGRACYSSSRTGLNSTSKTRRDRNGTKKATPRKDESNDRAVRAGTISDSDSDPEIDGHTMSRKAPTRFGAARKQPRGGSIDSHSDPTESEDKDSASDANSDSDNEQSSENNQESDSDHVSHSDEEPDSDHEPDLSFFLSGDRLIDLPTLEKFASGLQQHARRSVRSIAWDFRHADGTYSIPLRLVFKRINQFLEPGERIFCL